MWMRLCLLLSAILLLPGVAASEPLPPSAKQATMEEFQAFADGKTVEVVIFDLEVPVKATLLWDWKKKRITGDALVNGKDKIEVDTRLSFKGDMACADQEGGKPTCHLIFIDGDRFHEVRADGVLHATSTLKK
jgi:hypothetical protein